MIENEFRRPVSVDTAPRGSLCEWCGKPAEVQLTAIGGIAHNESGLFCNSCGQEFTRAVTSAAGTTTARPRQGGRFVPASARHRRAR